MKQSRSTTVGIAAIVLALVASTASLGAAAQEGDSLAAPAATRTSGVIDPVPLAPGEQGPVPAALTAPGEDEAVPAAPATVPAAPTAPGAPQDPVTPQATTPPTAPQAPAAPVAPQAPGSEPSAPQGEQPAAPQGEQPAPAQLGEPGPEMAMLAAASDNRIIVSVGGTRAADGTITPLAGAKFTLSDNGTTLRTEAEASCTTGADGTCEMRAPAAEWYQLLGVSYWAVMTSAPAGYFKIDTLYPDQTRTYRFKTGQMYSNAVSHINATSETSGRWAVGATNPVAAPRCGINVGMLVDLSSSLGGSQNQLRSAGTAFVDALAGTPTKIGLWTFGTDAPSKGVGNGNLALTSVADTAGAQTVRDRVGNLTVPGDNGTNWDAGLRSVAAQNSGAQKLDLLLVLTDGSPTSWGVPTLGNGTFTGLNMIEHAVFSANQIKQQGTRIMSVGIGSGLSSASSNLRAISGNTANVDYTTVSDYTALKAQLAELAGAQCDGTVNIVKTVEARDGSQSVGTGWGFTATAAQGPALTATTDDSGAASFRIPGMSSGTTTPVAVVESQRAGYEIKQVGGKNAVCLSGSTPVAVTNQGATGFTVDARANAAVTCTVINKDISKSAASIVIEKKWTLDGVTYNNGEQPVGSIEGFTTSVGEFTPGVERTGFQQGERVSLLAETGVTVPTGCSIDVADVRQDVVLTEGRNVFTVTNEIECTTLLVLKNKVSNGPADASTWSVRSEGPAGSLPGVQGNQGDAARITPGVPYALSATSPDRTYVQAGATTDGLYAGASGAWTCRPADASGTDEDAIIPGMGANGSVTLGHGERVLCTAVQSTTELVMTKTVNSGDMEGAAPGDWSLSATPAASTLELDTRTVRGGSAAGAVVSTIRPDTAYLLSESAGDERFVLDRITCAAEGGEAASPAGDSVSGAAGERITCEFVNSSRGLTVKKQAWDAESLAPGAMPQLGEYATGTVLAPLTALSWTYVVTNPGALAVTDISVTDDRLAADAVSCPAANAQSGGGFTLAPGQSMVCTASGSIGR